MVYLTLCTAAARAAWRRCISFRNTLMTTMTIVVTATVMAARVEGGRRRCSSDRVSGAGAGEGEGEALCFVENECICLMLP